MDDTRTFAHAEAIEKAAHCYTSHLYPLQLWMLSTALVDALLTTAATACLSDERAYTSCFCSLS